MRIFSLLLMFIDNAEEKEEEGEEKNTSKRPSAAKNNLENHVRKQSNMDGCGLVSYVKCVDKVESKLFHFATDHLPFLVAHAILCCCLLRVQRSKKKKTFAVHVDVHP